MLLEMSCLFWENAEGFRYLESLLSRNVSVSSPYQQELDQGSEGGLTEWAVRRWFQLHSICYDCFRVMLAGWISVVKSSTRSAENRSKSFARMRLLEQHDKCSVSCSSSIRLILPGKVTSQGKAPDQRNAVYGSYTPQSSQALERKVWNFYSIH